MWRRTRRERQGVISHTATHPHTRPARINPLHPRPSQVCFWRKATGSTHYAFVLLTPTCFCFALCYRKTSPSPGFVIKPKRYSLSVDTPHTTLAMNLCRLCTSLSLSPATSHAPVRFPLWSTFHLSSNQCSWKLFSDKLKQSTKWCGWGRGGVGNCTCSNALLSKCACENTILRN